jgi:hypothetical protein
VKTQYDSKERPAPATITLAVNSKEVAQMRMKRSAPSVHSDSKAIDVGVDLGSTGALNYYDRAPLSFDGKIEKILCVLMPLILSTNLLLAQNDPEQGSITNQFWADFNLSCSLSERWDFYGDMSFRTLVPNEWDRYGIRPSVRFQVPKLLFKDLKYNEELHAGIAFFFTSNSDYANRLEIQPFQGFRLDWPDRPRLRIRHYLRMEERFDMNTRNWKNTFGLRLRYLAEVTIRLQGDWFKHNKGVYLPTSVELFWNLIGARQFNDHLRVYAGLGNTFLEKLTCEFHLGYHYSRNTIVGDFNTNDIVYRVRTYYRL